MYRVRSSWGAQGAQGNPRGAQVAPGGTPERSPGGAPGSTPGYPRELGPRAVWTASMQTAGVSSGAQEPAMLHLPRAASPAGRFFKIAPGPIFGPWGGENRIPREKNIPISHVFIIVRPIFENHDSF